MDEKSLHAGHRKRMIEKVKAGVLSEHEVLEVLLYRLLPTKDTNLLAHRLIKIFGSLSGVLDASFENLTAVEGVGEKVATNLILLGKAFNVVEQSRGKTVRVRNWSTLHNIKVHLKEAFESLKSETFFIVLLDDKFRELTRIEYVNKEISRVSADLPELVSAIMVYKPKGVILAHNHPSGEKEPSETDDFSTRKINLICNINSVTLFDHVIYTSQDVFSYHHEGRLEKIKESSAIDKLLKERES